MHLLLPRVYSNTIICIESFAWEVWIFSSGKVQRPCDCASNIQWLYCLLLRSALPCGNSSDHTWSDEEMDLYLFALSHHPAEHKRTFKLKSLWTDTTLNRNRNKISQSPWKTEEWGIRFSFYSFCFYCKRRAGHPTVSNFALVPLHTFFWGGAQSWSHIASRWGLLQIWWITGSRQIVHADVSVCPRFRVSGSRVIAQRRSTRWPMTTAGFGVSAMKPHGMWGAHTALLRRLQWRHFSTT